MRITASLRNDRRRQSPDGPEGPPLTPPPEAPATPERAGRDRARPYGSAGNVTMEKLAEEEKGSGWLCRPLPFPMRFYAHTKT